MLRRQHKAVRIMVFLRNRTSAVVVQTTAQALNAVAAVLPVEVVALVAVVRLAAAVAVLVAALAAVVVEVAPEAEPQHPAAAVEAVAQADDLQTHNNTISNPPAHCVE